MNFGRTVMRALGVTAAIGFLAMAIPVPAQEADPQQFSQTEIESFASAAHSVNQIREKWVGRLRDAQNEEEATTLQQQGTAELVAAIEAEGLTVEKYNAIAGAGMRDRELHDRIIKLMDEGR